MRAFGAVMRRFCIVTVGGGVRALNLLGARCGYARESAGIEAEWTALRPRLHQTPSSRGLSSGPMDQPPGIWATLRRPRGGQMGPGDKSRDAGE